MAKGTSQKLSNGSALDFEAQLWAAADKMRFWTDLHPDLKADFILANPPFNMSDWGGENLRQDVSPAVMSAIGESQRQGRPSDECEIRFVAA